MVGFQASVEEVFQVTEGSREAPRVFHTAWREMNNELVMAISADPPVWPAAFGFHSCGEKSAYLFPADRREGCLLGPVSSSKAGEGAFLGSFPSTQRRTESRKRRGEEREAEVRVRVEKHRSQ